ncbi:MAG: hypothetical protein M3011_12015 [Actinomycetota bacterium]|nr:hypothetical protein [Actinomycetota bacterium]
MADGTSEDGENLDLSTVDPTRSLRSTLRGVASVVAPASVVTALLYYFGWTRTNSEAKHLGLDDSLLGYSTQDYLLRSMSSLFTPLAVGVVAVLVGLALHAALVAWADRPVVGNDAERRRALLLRGLTVVLAVAAVTLLVLGALGSRVSRPTRFVSLFAPVSVTLGIVLAGYAAHVGRRFLTFGHMGPPTPERNSLRLVSASLYLVLLFLSLFSAVAHYASVKGAELAVTVEQAVPSLPDVTLYSGKRLFLQPPVEETELGPDSSSFRYRYTGLKFLFLSNAHYFLRPSEPDASDVNIVIPESNDLRLELVHA